MKVQKVKLQKRSFTAAITLPRAMVLDLPEETLYLEARQYSDGRITLTPIHEDVEK